MFDAVRLGPKFAPVERINVNFFDAGLVAADKMARQPYSDHWQAQAPGHEKEYRGEADRTPAPAVHHPIEIAAFRVLTVVLVAGKTEFLKEVLINRPQNRLGIGPPVDARAQLGSPAIVESAVAFQICAGVLCEGQQPDCFLEVEFLPIVQAKRQESLIAVLHRKMLDDFAGAPAHG